MLKHYIIVFLISMVPIVELRGAVPVGTGFGLPWLPNLIVSMIGNMVPVPFIFFFARKILIWGADKKYTKKFFSWCIEKGHKGGVELQKTAGKNGMFIALALFVGIPLPGTGAWTGTLAASFIDLDFKKSVFAIMAGVLLAGVIMTTGSQAVALIVDNIYKWAGQVAVNFM